MNNLSQYISLNFKVILSGTKVPNQGFSVNDWLLVGWDGPQCRSIKVYNRYGYSVSDIGFVSWEDAIKFAEFFTATYEEFLPIWEEYEKADLPTICRFTVKNGIKIKKLLEMLKGKPTSFEPFVEMTKVEDQWTQLTMPF